MFCSPCSDPGVLSPLLSLISLLLNLFNPLALLLLVSPAGTGCHLLVSFLPGAHLRCWREQHRKVACWSNFCNFRKSRKEEDESHASCLFILLPCVVMRRNVYTSEGLLFFIISFNHLDSHEQEGFCKILSSWFNTLFTMMWKREPCCM